jgi:uncharacterized membrane protein
MGAGVLIALYLTLVHYTSVVGLACPGQGSSLIDCGNVLTSPESIWWGIPVPLWGLLWFLAGMVLRWQEPVWGDYSWWSPALWIWAIIGVASVIWLVYAEFFLIHALCVWCSALHLIILGLFTDLMLAPPREA